MNAVDVQGIANGWNKRKKQCSLIIRWWFYLYLFVVSVLFDSIAECSPTWRSSNPLNRAHFRNYITYGQCTYKYTFNKCFALILFGCRFFRWRCGVLFVFHFQFIKFHKFGSKSNYANRNALCLRHYLFRALSSHSTSSCACWTLCSSTSNAFNGNKWKREQRTHVYASEYKRNLLFHISQMNSYISNAPRLMYLAANVFEGISTTFKSL